MEMKHLLLFFQLYVFVAAAKECSELEMKEMQHKYSECTDNAYNNFQDRISKMRPENLSERQRATCQYFIEASDNCGRVLSSCYHEETIIDIKDNIIKERLIQDGGQFSDSCTTVKLFKQRQSRKESIGNTVTRQEECSNEESESIRTQMGTCSNSAASNVHYSIENITNPVLISDIVCQALTTIGNDCIKDLSKCFSIQDIDALRSAMLQQFHGFLLQITEEKIDKKSLQNCDVLNNEYILQVPYEETIHVIDEPQDITNLEEDTKDFVLTEVAFQEINVENVEVIPNIPTKTTAQHIEESTQQSEDSGKTNVENHKTSQKDTQRTTHIPESIQLTDQANTITQNKEDSGKSNSEVKITTNTATSSSSAGVNGADNERLTWPKDDHGNGNISKLTTLTILFSFIINCLL